MLQAAETESCRPQTASPARLILPNRYPGASSTELLDPPELLVLHMGMLVLNSKNETGNHLKVVWHF